MGATQSRRSAQPPVSRSLVDVWREINRDETIIDLLVGIECILLALWMAMVYVNGFALYTVDPSVVSSTGWAHTVSHLGWWNIIYFVAIYFGLRNTKYVLPPPSPSTGNTPRLKLSVGRNKT